MYYKSAAVMHFSLRHTFQGLTVILHRYAKLIDKVITATFETGAIAIIIGLIWVFTLMVQTAHCGGHACDSAMLHLHWMPTFFESFSRYF